MTETPETAAKICGRNYVSGDSSLAIPQGIAKLLTFGAHNWLTILTVLTVAYVGLSFVAPIALAQGHEVLAHRIYHLYSFTCHQLPASSFWLFGEGTTFSAGLDGVTVQDSLFASREFVGTAATGFKSGMCWRTLAIYSTLAMLLLGFMGTGQKWRALPLWAALVLILPMAADGVSQMMNLRESNLLLRLVTGSLFSLGLAWATLPHIDTAMRCVAAELQGN